MPFAGTAPTQFELAIANHEASAQIARALRELGRNRQFHLVELGLDAGLAFDCSNPEQVVNRRHAVGFAQYVDQGPDKKRVAVRADQRQRWPSGARRKKTSMPSGAVIWLKSSTPRRIDGSVRQASISAMLIPG